jgi:probable F420-dependent oxidoreductase
MEFGLSFPQKDIGNDPIVIRDFVQAAEGLGFSRLTFVDHVLGAPATATDDPSWSEGYTIESSFHEPMTLLAYIAGFTSEIGLVTANIILPQRQTVLVAKQAAEIDLLSGGRLTLGIGLGWNQIEYHALGMDFTNRGKRVEEQIDLLRRLWTEDTVAFDGDWHQFEAAGLNPRPVQQPIPIWFGAVADAAIRRAGRLGDGLLVFPHFKELEEAGAKIKLFQDSAAAAGRDPAALNVDATIYAREGKGGVDDWRRAVENWQSIGATSISFRTADSGYATIDEHVAAMEQLITG